jgi:hypothetical protein
MKTVIGAGMTIKNVTTSSKNFDLKQVGNQTFQTFLNGYLIEDPNKDLILSNIVFNGKKLIIGGIEYNIINGIWTKDPIKVVSESLPETILTKNEIPK